MGASDGEQSSGVAPPHVLIFPFPLQGHITPLLKLAEVLSLSGIRVTFLNTDHNQRRLLSSASVRARLARRPGLHLRSIPGGLPDNNPGDLKQAAQMIKAFDAAALPRLREILSSKGTEEAPPVTCVVADALVRLPVDVAEELGLPIIAFRASSASSFWAYQRIPELVATGIIPFQDGCDLDKLVACVPGTESFLRRRDLPSLCQVKDTEEPILEFWREMIQSATRYRGLVFNTTEFAESTVLTHIRGVVSIYPIGPLDGLLRAVEISKGSAGDGEHYDAVPSSNSTSLWQEDRGCMEWLDARRPASVVYVSFGSVALLKREQQMELWHGLVNSGYHFLWVVKPGVVEDGGWDGGVPAEVAAGTEERCFLAEWVPQQEVLAHPAVGCFFTHSGWNSTLESMWAGVPMVCLPNFADQQIISRFVSEVWRIGVDIKDTYDRGSVEKAVREVMAGERGPEMRAAAASMSKMARECVEEGGSSYTTLERLVRDIRTMSSSTP